MIEQVALFAVLIVAEARWPCRTVFDHVVNETGSGTGVGVGTGVATWKWTVGSNTETGTWPIEVTCTAAGRTGTQTVDFAVTN